MNDRELLESAAKAVSVNLVWSDGMPKEITEHWSGDPTEPPMERVWDWNPLADDGDALRLAVKLRISLMMRGISLSAFDQGETLHIEEWYSGDMANATRRAIVRAAAAIGKKVDAPLVRAD